MILIETGTLQSKLRIVFYKIINTKLSVRFWYKYNNYNHNYKSTGQMMSLPIVLYNKIIIKKKNNNKIL